MFTGIIEGLGTVSQVRNDGTNKNFAISSPISNQLQVDQSVTHNGVCLTVTKVTGNTHWVTVVAESLQKSNLGSLKVGDSINLERSMVANGRFDGHIVQGHVDQTGKVKSIKEMEGSWLFEFEYDPSVGNMTVEKGSICVNGVSLTCFNSTNNGFSVAIIPFTYRHTNFNTLIKGDSVNLEFDIIGKYVKRLVNPV